jgi:predicted amidophosphoribosyltransferase
VTTMTTVAAITKVLQQHGVRRVDVWCLARASR